MVTIYDLARETGFSAPTISKALNGNGKLNPKTRQIILDAAAKAGYKPNMAAKSLTTKMSFKLICISPISVKLYLSCKFSVNT